MNIHGKIMYHTSPPVPSHYSLKYVRRHEEPHLIEGQVRSSSLAIIFIGPAMDQSRQCDTWLLIFCILIRRFHAITCTHFHRLLT